jgi:hypothetical protein
MCETVFRLFSSLTLSNFPSRREHASPSCSPLSLLVLAQRILLSVTSSEQRKKCAASAPHASRALTKEKKRKWPSTVRSASRASGARPERPLGGAGWVSHPPSLGKGERDRKSAGRGGGERDAKKIALAFRCRCCRSAAAAVPPPSSRRFFSFSTSPPLSLFAHPPPSLLLTESKPLLPLRLDPGQRRRRRGGKRGERGDDGLL